MLNLNISTPPLILNEIRIKYKEKRLECDLTQEGLSTKSGVSLGSLKRFETTGQISLESLLKLSLILECLDDFNYLANPKKKVPDSIDELMKQKHIKKRGSIK
ncbi:helix-turn-helix domain-containing protein [Sulfurimonas sp. CS5]|uniref:helix-turn-helix domain-containing protein n=1 Tax=Sulfurimonas sp. CS5 TaxID=3391145 RepID=UPI0039ED0EEA